MEAGPSPSNCSTVGGAPWVSTTPTPLPPRASSSVLSKASLGAVQLADPLGEDTLQRCRRVLGLDDPITLQTASALARSLVALDDREPARALSEDTLQRCRRVLGPDHAATLTAAPTLILALIRLGEFEPARALG